MPLRRGFKLGDWVVYPLEGRLSRDGEDRRVQPRSMEVLLCLAQAAGEVVERERLLRQIWGERAVSDEPLTRCIGELRRALGDNRADPEYIRTIPKRGYQLLQSAIPVSDAPLRRVAARSKLLPAIAVVGLLAVSLGVIDWLRDGPTRTGDTVATDRSIAVLPFVDMSAAGDQEHMSDGIAEELLNLLARIPDLRVISRTSAFSFKGKPVEIRDIAKRLDVAYVLEGSVRTAGDQIRVTTQLVDARTDSHVWSATYDRELEDIFAIQDEIASAVVGKLELTLLGDAPKPRQTDPEAYSLFLKGRYLHEHPGGDSFRRALEYYEAALEIDDSYVPAWVWLAALYDDMVNSLGLPRDEVGRRARHAIDRALTIDPQDPLALGMSGVLIDAWDNDLVAAATRMQEALDLDPNNPILLRWSAILLDSLGRHDEAVRVMEHLFAQDPIGDISKVNLASVYLEAGRAQDAIRVCRIEVELNAESNPCQSRLIVAYLIDGEPSSALNVLKQVRGSRVYVRLAPMTYFALGRRTEFDTALTALEQAFDTGDVGMAYWLGRTHLFAGNRDAALDWFERAADAGVLRATPDSVHFVTLRGEPRWEALLQRTGRDSARLRRIKLAVPVPTAAAPQR